VEEDTVEVEVLPPLPEGPVLLAGRRSGNDLQLFAVAVRNGTVWEAVPDGGGDPRTLSRFSDTLLAPGSRYTLFSEGIRVGTFIQQGPAELGSNTCSQRPLLNGVAELSPVGSAARTFLAIPEEALGDRPHGSYRAKSSTYEQRVGSLQAAGNVIARTGAPWPPSVLETRQDLQILTLDGEEEPGLAATFVFQDRLGFGDAPDAAYALFFTAKAVGPENYQPDFIWYRRVRDGGKAWPRLFSNLDLDGDGKDELLLEVFGTSERWLQLEGYRGNGWRTLHVDPCAEAPGTAWGEGQAAAP
jgi:hypothetical protein